MLVYLLLLLNVLMLFFTFSSFSDKKKIIVPLAEAISVFLCLYSVTSGIMWMCNVFSVEFCLLAVTFLVSIAFAVVYFKSETKGLGFFKIETVRIDYRVFLNRLAIFLAVFLSLGAYSTIGIGYNDGNAQIQAVSILKGNNSRIFEIEEYENIPTDSDYEYYFFDAISNMDDENFIADYWLTSVDTEEGEAYKMMGEFGCNPVYPSILALSASLFGIGRMAFIQAVFAFCLFVFVDEILKAIKCDWKLRSVLVLLLGVSPIIVYCNHTTLVEPIIGFCMIFFMYFLLCKNTKLQILSALGVTTFAFIHSSIYTMIPLFLILYWMLFIHSGKFRHLISSGIAVLGYNLSFVFLSIVANERTSLDYRKGIPFLGTKYYLFVFVITAVALIVAMLLIILKKPFQSDKFTEFRRTKGKSVFKIIMAAISVVPVIMTVIIIILKCYTIGDFQKITFISFIVCSGVILIPVILFKMLTARYEFGIKEAAVLIGFAYAFILYSSVMKIMIGDYYYDARYLSSFIPFIILAAGMMLKTNRERDYYFIPVIGIIILFMPYTTSLLSSKTETRLERDVYESVLESVEDYSDENTVVLVEKPLLKYFYYPLLAANVKVYPMSPEYHNTFYFDNQDTYANVIYITDDKGNDFADNGLVLYSKINNSCNVNAGNISKITGLPNEFIKYQYYRIQVIKLNSLYKLLDYNQFDELTWDNIQLSVDEVEIDEDDIAHVTLSITDTSIVYVNEKYLLSYHLELENGYSIFDLPRTNTGKLITGDYSFDFDLSKQNGDMTVVFDVVEEGVAWYSYTNDVPAVEFTKGDDGWNYTVKIRETE